MQTPCRKRVDQFSHKSDVRRTSDVDEKQRSHTDVIVDVTQREVAVGTIGIAVKRHRTRRPEMPVTLTIRRPNSELLKTLILNL